MGPPRTSLDRLWSRARERVRPGLAVGLVSFGVALWFWFPAFLRFWNTGFGDWQMVHHNWEAGRVALERFGEWPLWDPFHCGGVTIVGNPETQHYSPFFFLALLLGTTLTLKLQILIYAWAGIAGLYLFARREQGLGVPASWLAAVAWGCCGFFAWHIGGGHGTFITFYLAPWMLITWRRAAEDLRWVAAVVALMSLTIFEGGTYPAPYFVLLLAFDAVVRLVCGPHRWGVVRAGLVAAPLTALVTSIRLLPIRDTLSRMPRVVQGTDALWPHEVAEMLLRRQFPWFHPDHEYVWNEYSNYLGPGLVALALVGLVLAVRGRRFELLAGLVVFGALMLGHHGPYWPWALLHELPVYDSLRVPSRFSVLFVFYLVLVAALVVDALPRWLERRRLAERGPRWATAVRLAPWVLTVAVLADPFYLNQRFLDRWDGPPIDTETEPADPFRVIKAPNYHWIYASLPHRNEGTPMCYRGNMRWDISKKLWTGEDKPQARVVDAAGKVTDWGRTPSTVWAEVRLEDDGIVVFNQNHDPGWKSAHGREVLEHQGRLAVRMPPGERRAELRYRPESFSRAIPLTLAGALLTGALAPLGAGRWRRLFAGGRRGGAGE